eukprot:IDg20102t1
MTAPGNHAEKMTSRRNSASELSILRLKLTNSRKVHMRVMEHIFSLGLLNVRTQTICLFTMAYYMIQANSCNCHCEFRLPEFKNKLCNNVLCQLLNISVKPYKKWRRVAEPKRDVLPLHHGMVCQKSNAEKPEVRETVLIFDKHIADYDGHPLPARVRAAEKHLMEEIEGTEQMGVLPPRYTKRVLFLEYSKLHLQV